MSMNECGEIMRETKKEDKNKCSLRILSRKERFFYLGNQITELKEELTSAETEETVKKSLSKLSYLMNNCLNDSEYSDVKPITEDIYATINGVRLHDFTRSELDNMLQKLLDKIAEIIEQEKKREKAKKLEELFMQLAEHSNEIAEIIDINKIFG